MSYHPAAYFAGVRHQSCSEAHYCVGGEKPLRVVAGGYHKFQFAVKVNIRQHRRCVYVVADFD